MSEYLASFPFSTELPSQTEICGLILDPNSTLVFDFDDTIAKTSPFQRQAIQGIVEANSGLKLEIDHEFAMQHLRGKQPDEIFRIVYRNYCNINDEELIMLSVEQREDALVAQVLNASELNSSLMFGVDTLIRKLRTARKQAGIASHSGDKFIKAFLEKAMIDGTPIADVFPATTIVGGETIRRVATEVNTSESSEITLYKPIGFSIYAAACAIDKKLPNAILYIGDSKIDLQSSMGRVDMIGLIINDNELLL